MSASDLRSVATQLIAAEANAEAVYLVERTSDSQDEMRLRQGFIKGLQRAAELIGDAYARVGG